MKRKGIWTVSLYLIATIIFIGVEILIYIKNNEAIEVRYNDNIVMLQLSCTKGDLAWISMVEDIIEKFEEENPNIKIDLKLDKSTGLYEEYMRKLAATGELGDIVEIRQKEFFDAGYMAVLPESLVKVKDSNNYEIDGQVYGLKLYLSTMGIIYNKEIFNNLTLTEPSNYGEFLEICKVLKENGYNPLVVGGGDEWHMKSWLNHFYISDILLENPNWEEELREGKVSWLDDEPRNMFNHLYELFNSGYVNETWRTDKDSVMAAKIARGDAVMLYSGTWMFKQIYNENSNIELGWFFVPNEYGDTLVRDISEGYWAITNECAADEEKYKAAVKFLEFYNSGLIQEEIHIKLGDLSKCISNIDDKSSMVQKEAEKEFYEFKNHTRLFLGDENYPSSFQKSVLAAEMLLINNEITIDEALEICNEAYLSSTFERE